MVDADVIVVVGAIIVKLVVLKDADCVGVEFTVELVVGGGMMVKLAILRDVVKSTVVEAVVKTVVRVVDFIDVVLVVWGNVMSFPRQACIISVPRSAKLKTELLDASTLLHAVCMPSSISLIPALQVSEQCSPDAKSALVQPIIVLW